MRHALKYELCGLEGEEVQLCVDWSFDDRASLRETTFKPGCSCVFTNHYELIDKGIITCNQWLHWKGGGKRCEVHEWVYLEYMMHVEESIEAMYGRSLINRTQSFPIAVTRMT